MVRDSGINILFNPYLNFLLGSGKRDNLKEIFLNESLKTYSCNSKHCPEILVNITSLSFDL